MARSNQAELDELLEKWQKILRLQDWDIKIRFASYGEMDGDEGECNVTSERKHASIKVLRPEHFNHKDKDLPYNLEDTVVHELLHIYLEQCHISPEHRIQEEQAICMITAALLSLDND